jgi:hypothetical protein
MAYWHGRFQVPVSRVPQTSPNVKARFARKRERGHPANVEVPELATQNAERLDVLPLTTLTALPASTDGACDGQTPELPAQTENAFNVHDVVGTGQGTCGTQAGEDEGIHGAGQGGCQRVERASVQPLVARGRRRRKVDLDPAFLP